MNETEKTNKEEDSRSLWNKFIDKFQKTPQSTQDMVALVDAATENDVIDEDAKRIIEGALEVSEKQARDIMIPRPQMTVIKATDPLAYNLEKIIASGHSRYPVTGESMDEILGILLTKDLLGVLLTKDLIHLIASPENKEINGDERLKEPLIENEDMLRLLRPTVYVPESKRLNVLLREFREERNHMALVIDEYGSLAGLITIEDVLEEIVGDIEDEHDEKEDAPIKKISNNHFIIKALTPLDDFNEFFEASFDEDEFDTVGGFITNKFGHLPKRHEEITINDYHFYITQANSRQILALRMKRLNPDLGKPRE